MSGQPGRSGRNPPPAERVAEMAAFYRMPHSLRQTAEHFGLSIEGARRALRRAGVTMHAAHHNLQPRALGSGGGRQG